MIVTVHLYFCLQNGALYIIYFQPSTTRLWANRIPLPTKISAFYGAKAYGGDHYGLQEDTDRHFDLEVTGSKLNPQITYGKVHVVQPTIDISKSKLISNYRYFKVNFLGPENVVQSVGHLTRKSEVLGSIPGLATYFRFSFRFFKRGSCQLLAKVCARSTG